MNRGVRLVVGTGLALVAVAATGVLTRLPYAAEPGDQAEVRLTWRARTALVEECRRLTDAEREALPVHMRREEICEGRVSSYRLDVVVDGETRHSSIVKGSGARGDRPLYVFDAIRLPPGPHNIQVVFARVDAAGRPVMPPDPRDTRGEIDGALMGDAGDAGDASAAGQTRRGPNGSVSTVPDRLELGADLELAAGDVVLVTYDATGRRLVLRRGPGGT
jgi:hypothetical protein